MAGPALLLYFFVFAPLTETVSHVPAFEELFRGPAATESVPAAVEALESKTHLILRPKPDSLLATARVWLTLPDYCIGDNEVNELQKARCKGLWAQAFAFTGIALFPFLVLTVFFMSLQHQVSQFFRKARKTIQGGQALSIATVTQPAEAPGDFFSWVHCLQRVSVQLASRQQQVIYLDPRTDIPQPGQTMALFDLGTMFGVKRYVGIVYYPHVAVVSSRGR